jgi:hypothetical protein
MIELCDISPANWLTFTFMLGSQMFKSDSYYFSWTVQGSNPSKGKRFSLFSKMSRPAPWAHLASSYIGVIGTLLQGQSIRDVRLISPPSSAKVRNKWSHTSTTPKCLKGMGRGNITSCCYCVFFLLIPHPTVTFKNFWINEMYNIWMCVYKLIPFVHFNDTLNSLKTISYVNKELKVPENCH